MSKINADTITDLFSINKKIIPTLCLQLTMLHENDETELGKRYDDGAIKMF